MRYTHYLDKINQQGQHKASKIWRAISIVGVLGLVGALGVIGAINNTASSASALSYSTSSDISFTFKPTLSIGLSTDSLTIDNLVPGNTNDSNKVTVTVSSNTPYGYVLSAGVGSNESTDPYYNTSDLVHDNSTIPTPTTNKFTSIDTSASLSNLDTDNTWGYSTSTDNGTTWSTYSGLSHTTTKPLLDISDPAQPSTIDFKIAARSSTTQASGTYNNVITFYAVGKPEPPDYMQDTTTIKSKLVNIGDTMQAVDSRDGKKYWITKLADGNIWMTQNLDFDIVDGGAALNSTNTDVPVNWADAGNLANTYATGTTTWNGSTTAPESYDPGNLYWNGELNENWDGTLDNMTTESGDSYYHIGNYYNWTAAVAMNNSSSYTTNKRDVNQSICPAGWRLPTYSSDKSYRNLVSAQGLTAGTSGNIQNSPAYFVYGGAWGGSSYAVDSLGYYWSSVVYSSNNAYQLLFSADGGLYPQDGGGRNSGYPLRCVAR